jgi:hypothetical protein
MTESRTQPLAPGQHESANFSDWTRELIVELRPPLLFVDEERVEAPFDATRHTRQT